MKAYYINLDRRTDRRAVMEQQLERLAIVGERITAIRPEDLSSDLLAQHARIGAHTRFSLREFTVGVSHAQACRQFLAGTDSHGLILEDDIVLSEKLPAFLTAFQSNPMSIDLLRLETFNAPVQLSVRTMGQIAGFSLHSLHGWTWGSAAYVISRVAAKALLDTPGALNNVIDRVLYRPHHTVLGPILRRQLVPALAIQADRMDGQVWGADSDITAGRTEGLKAPHPTVKQTIERFVENEVLIGLPSALHRIAGLSAKRTIPFDAK